MDTSREFDSKEESSLVVIGIPLYNEEKFIAATLQSAVDQTYRNICVVVADNCSSDSTFSIAERFAAADPRIRLFRHDQNRGILYNFRFVRDQLSSKYFMWLGGHDLISPEYVEAAVARLESDGSIAMVYPEAIEIDVADQIVSPAYADYETTGMSPPHAMIKVARNFLNGYPIHGIFRTEVVRKLAIDPVIAADLAVLLQSNFYGTTSKVKMLGYKRRVVRRETSQSQSQRHKDVGMFDSSELSPFNYLLLKMWKNIFLSGRLSISAKIKAMLGLRRVFRDRFGVYWKSLLLSVVQTAGGAGIVKGYLNLKRKRSRGISGLD